MQLFDGRLGRSRRPGVDERPKSIDVPSVCRSGDIYEARNDYWCADSRHQRSIVSPTGKGERRCDGPVECRSADALVDASGGEDSGNALRRLWAVVGGKFSRQVQSLPLDRQSIDYRPTSRPRLPTMPTCRLKPPMSWWLRLRRMQGSRPRTKVSRRCWLRSTVADHYMPPRPHRLGLSFIRSPFRP